VILTGRDKGSVDLLERIRINEIVGYRSTHISMEELFKNLGKDYNNRQDYGHIIGIIERDRVAFIDNIWDVAKDMLCEHTLEIYRSLYKLCLRRWYRNNRTLLYSLGDGWGTPLNYDTFKKIEEAFARRDSQIIVNKIRVLEKANIQLPYKAPIKALELELEKIKKLEIKKKCSKCGAMTTEDICSLCGSPTV